MPDIKVTVFVDSNGTHLHQIYTGLYMLWQKKKIDLVLKTGLRVTQSRPNRQFLALQVEAVGNTKKCIFDLQDSPVLGLASALDWCDLYFKRSLEQSTLVGLNEANTEKLRPFGFNYQVVSSSRLFFLQRFLLEFLSRPYSPFSAKNRFHLSNWKEYFEAVWTAKPSPLLSPEVLGPSGDVVSDTILFQCRLWNPAEVAERNRADTEAVNLERIELLRRLKAEFGKSFIGGLQHNDYAKQAAPDLLIGSRGMGGRIAYIDQVKRSRIVISSAGLLGSNGWKLGEYVALGKCILSEPITTRLPGEFNAGFHYASFIGSDACLGKVQELFDDKQKTTAYGKRAATYFREHLAPDVLMSKHIGELTSQ